MKTPERSVDEILENLYENKPFLVPTAKFDKTELKYGDWLWFENWLTQTLTAERQRCEEVVEAERERICNDIDEMWSALYGAYLNNQDLRELIKNVVTQTNKLK